MHCKLCCCVHYHCIDVAGIYSLIFAKWQYIKTQFCSCKFRTTIDKGKQSEWAFSIWTSLPFRSRTYVLQTLMIMRRGAMKQTCFCCQFSSSSVIVRVRASPEKDCCCRDWCFDKLSGSHLYSQVIITNATVVCIECRQLLKIHFFLFYRDSITWCANLHSKKFLWKLENKDSFT